MLFVIRQLSLIKAVPLNQIFEIQCIMKYIRISLFGYEHKVCDFGRICVNFKMTFITYWAYARLTHLNKKTF
jgi:hypothetical protein